MDQPHFLLKNSFTYFSRPRKDSIYRLLSLLNKTSMMKIERTHAIPIYVPYKNSLEN